MLQTVHCTTSCIYNPYMVEQEQSIVSVDTFYLKERTDGTEKPIYPHRLSLNLSLPSKSTTFHLQEYWWAAVLGAVGIVVVMVKVAVEQKN